jgi:hypothetical protein
VEELKEADHHIAECQETLGKHNIQCGADGSLLIPINELIEERDRYRKALLGADRALSNGWVSQAWRFVQEALNPTGDTNG